MPATDVRVVTRGDVQLVAHVVGPASAPVVLLVHGYPDTHSVWSEIVPRLARTHRVVTYDVRGAGASTRPPDEAAYDLRELADDAAAVIDACADGREVHVVGHDWGAIQSWELLTTARARGRVASFTSISGPCLDHVSHWIRDALPFRAPKSAASKSPGLVSGSERGASQSPGLVSGSERSASKSPGLISGSERSASKAPGLVSGGGSLAEGTRDRSTRTGLVAVMGQAPRSVYIALLRVPGLAERVWPVIGPYWSALRDRTEGGESAGVAAATVAEDGVAGARLYRRNMVRRLRTPRGDAFVRAPVQVVVPLRDTFVSRALAVEAPRRWCDEMSVREIDGGHWCVRSAPDAVARAIAEHVARVERRRAGLMPIGAVGGEAGSRGEIRPRRVSFDLSRTPVPWIPGDRFTSHVADVLHLLLPAGERWFVDVYREALALVTDERLRADMRGFMGQEATHARVHDLVLDHLRARGVETEPYTRRVEWMFEHVFGAKPPRGVPLSPRLWLELRLGGIAAVEHFTCVLGRWICERSAALDAAGADRMMLSLLRWHGAEEIEHRSVAFDTLAHVAGRRAYAMRAAGLLLAVPIMTFLWDRGTRYFVDRDPEMSDTRAGYLAFIRAARQRRLPGRELVAAIPRFLSRGYDPQHEAHSEVARAHLQNAR
ncbi:MAG TPA: alpha/beta fold hydrolase [Kofleriaceae bacterium]|nr:alpha/beta fold hydrolase [Kofleriaceae bacterium]